MKEIIKLPIIVCGKIIDDFDNETIDVEYSSNIVIRLPKLTKQYIHDILNNRISFADEALFDVTEYMSKASQAWASPESELRRESINLCSRITGYSREMIEHDYTVIGHHFTYRNNFYDMFDAELGTHRIMDEWVRNQLCRIKAFPKGRVFHFLVGNVPLAGIFSIIRSVITKNQTIVKLPSRDLVTCLFFVLNMMKANGDNHRFNRGLSVFYLEKNSEYIYNIANNCNLVCAWGKGESMRSIKRNLNENVKFLEFGPKYSLSVLQDCNSDLEAAAIGIAHDISVYDQEACFSPQHLFVVGDAKKIVKPLIKWLNIQNTGLPSGHNTIDNDNHLLRVKLEAKARGWEIFEGNSWTLIINDPYEVIEHPLGRTLFIHSVNSIEEVKEFVDENTQTVSLYPYNDPEKIADILCAKGALRICQAGLVSYPREGWTHDGMYALRDFVNLACIEDSYDIISKYATTRESVQQALYMLFGMQNQDFFNHIIINDKEDNNA